MSLASTWPSLLRTLRWAASDPRKMVDHPKRRRARCAQSAERFSQLLALLRGNRRRRVERFTARKSPGGSSWWGIEAANVEVRRSWVDRWIAYGWIEFTYDGDGYTACVLPAWAEDARAS